MDQIVFVFDLESFLPVTTDEDADETLLERGLEDVKEAVLKVLTHGRILERRSDLSSFGFRFYSSTGFFSVAPAVTGEWHELSLSSWELLEDQLRERFDSVLSALQRRAPHTRLTGRMTPAAAACKAVDEVTVLYTWDRPALFSPLKAVRKSQLRFGNTVFLVTRLPPSLSDLPGFLGVNQANIKPRHVMENIVSKRANSHFSGELNISLHVLNTETRHIEEQVVQVFDKALKELKGGVIQLSSLSSRSAWRGVSPSSSAADGQFLEVRRSFCPLPASAVLSSHLATSTLPARVLERNYYSHTSISLNNNTNIQLELRAGPVTIPELTPVCFVKTSVFQPDQVWQRTNVVWSKLETDDQLNALLSFLQLSAKCLVLEDPDSLLVVMFYNSDCTATLASLDRVESSFYRQIFTNKITVYPICDEISAIMDVQDPVKLVRPKTIKSQAPLNLRFDGTSLERWRVPNQPVGDFLEKLKSSQVPSSQNETHMKLLLGVRESYVARTGMQQKENKKLTKKPSAMSNASTTSVASSGVTRKTGRSGRSRGEMLKDLGVLNRSCALVDTEETKKDESNENEMLTEKTNSAEEMMTKMGDPNVDTDVLIDRLVELQKEALSGGDDVVLAGYSEACVSFLLKHLDITGVSKTSLEQVVTARLLADVATVARSSRSDLAMRVSQHKVQVLLMAEVHWLLANTESQEEFEENILAHMRQMSLHGGQDVMVEFLAGTLTQCYVVRQPELLCLLYDELEQQRPSSLYLCSPVRSVQPNSVKSSSSLGPSSASSMHPPAPAVVVNKPSKANLSRSFRSRPKSFDTSLTSRQIDLSAATRRERRSTKLVTTGRMVSSKLKISGKKKLLGAKSPRKTKQMVKRNLNFDGSGKTPDRGKSPRKKVSVTTPSKARKYQGSRPVRTPGKTHRILCPETPANKVKRRKSDGNTSVAETPEKTEETLTPRRQQASMAIRRRASFYPRTFPSTRPENISMNVTNTSTMNITAVLDDSQTGLNKSLILFPHLHNRKRKRDDSVGPSGDQDDGQSPLRKARKRLNSFSEPQTNLESTHLLSTAHLGQHLGQHIEQHLGDRLNISSIPNINRTPVKSNALPGADFFSPTKRVHFNTKPQPPTPKSGVKAKSILKSPSTETFKTPVKTPVKTPSKVSVQLLQSPAALRPADSRPQLRLTPVRVSPRRDIGGGSNKSQRFVDSDSSMPPLLSPGQRSPVFSSKIRQRNLSISAVASDESQSPKVLPKVMKAPTCQNHFTPSMMSTLQPPRDGKKDLTVFDPCLASTINDLHLSSTGSSKLPAMTTQDILNSTSLPSLTSTLIKPSSQLQADIFDNSALYPPSLTTLKSESIPVVKIETTPETHVDSREITPVKVRFEEEGELELVSPTKKENIQNIMRSLDGAEVKARSKFGKTESEQSVATSAGRTSPEPNPSSGYSSEQQPGGLSPEYLEHNQESPCMLQVSSPDRIQPEMDMKLGCQVAKTRKNKELEGLQDLMSPYFSTENSKRRTASDKPKPEAKKNKLIKQKQSKKRKGSSIKSGEESAAIVTPSSKKSKRSVRSVFYKEFESEESQTDDEEYIRIVGERFGDSENIRENTRENHDNNDNKADRAKITLKSPARFKCRYCGGGFRTRKGLRAHEASELEERKGLVKTSAGPFSIKNFDGSDIEYDQEAEVSLGSKKVEGGVAQSSADPVGVKTPKSIACLQDQLSAYFSPSSGASSSRARRNTDRLSDVYSLAQLTPKSSRPRARTLARTALLREAATSTPNDNEATEVSRGQRQSRARTVSYAEFPDFDSTDSDISLCDIGPKKSLGRKLVVNSRPSISPLVSSGCKKALVVKNLNDSQEIQDLVTLTRKVRSREVTPLKTPEKCEGLSSGNTSLASPGKYFSVGQVTETPTGQIKLKLNRINKPQQDSCSSPLITNKPDTSKKKLSNKIRTDGSSKLFPKMSRSACKEMGMSPSRLVSIMTSKTPPKPKAVTVKIPEKENLPNTVDRERENQDTPRRIKIRINKISSVNPERSSDWKAETIVSPEKTVKESPARSFTPLSSSSLHKLTTSPIIHTQVDEKKKRRNKVHKQLSYI